MRTATVGSSAEFCSFLFLRCSWRVGDGRRKAAQERESGCAQGGGASAVLIFLFAAMLDRYMGSWPCVVGDACVVCDMLVMRPSLSGRSIDPRSPSYARRGDGDFGIERAGYGFSVAACPMLSDVRSQPCFSRVAHGWFSRTRGGGGGKRSPTSGRRESLERPAAEGGACIICVPVHRVPVVRAV